MATLITLYLTLLFAYICSENARNFKGSSALALLLLNITGIIGQAAFLGLSIWAAFLLPWWHVAIMVVLSYLTAGIVSVPIRLIPYSFIISIPLCWASAIISLLLLITH